MGDMFDEDLIRELGLDPAEINGPKQEAPKKVDRPAPAKPATPSGAVPGASPVKPEATKPAATPDRPAAAKPPVRPGVPNSPSVASQQQPQQQVKSPLPSQESLEQEALKVSQDIPVLLTAVIGKKTVKLKDVVELKTGEMIEFKKSPQEPIDIVANGKLVAKAELVVIDGKIGVRVQKLIR